MYQPRFESDFSHDCTACAAMCCVAHKLDKEPDIFLFDKVAGEVCANLTRVDDSVHRFQCAIWDELGRIGCNGCLNYGCGGAGNAVTKLFESIGLPADYKKEAGFDAFTFRWLDENRHNLFVWSVEALDSYRKQYEAEWISEEGRDMSLRALEKTLAELVGDLSFDDAREIVTKAKFEKSLDQHLVMEMKA